MMNSTKQIALSTVCASMVSSQTQRYMRKTVSETNTISSLNTDSMNDQQLMALVAEQPTVAIAALYDRYGNYVLSVALRMVGDRNVAEEITQDVFLGCWRNAASYNPQRASVLTWLLRITHNRSIDELRSRRHQNRKRETNWEYAPQDMLASAQSMDVVLTQSQIRDALDTLPHNQREAVEMLYFGGLSRKEVADKLSTPLGTINTRLRLAMDKLRSMLIPGPGDEK
ncbi:MAG: hypothetical protein GFH27_549321n153 [Chloroflexi bacterium AL-W]|nr:hypothetical protein [Chloroflexi bacterium AL-N1]NOK65030.1 hypothetical protein [Chloroflexi bacterium AL-N10]NOK76800.1 hypothetical protein [Chloroflexi bacterium AL-N5]NOK84692.1 hypothetical protein [Chloroflexi bacterium AL-W]NOK86483.1 hypothetical protein [Chloroflexi bacterium AL-N15]